MCNNNTVYFTTRSNRSQYNVIFQLLSNATLFNPVFTLYLFILFKLYKILFYLLCL